MEETDGAEEVGILRHHGEDHEDQGGEGGDHQLCAGADLIKEAADKATNQHTTPVEGGKRSAELGGHGEVIHRIEDDIGTHADLHTDVEEEGHQPE